MPERIHIDPWVYWIWAVEALIIPLDWLAAAFFSALVHEASHLFMICSLGRSVNSITILPGGAQIHVEPMDPWQELLCALAGPAGSLCLILIVSFFPKAAICGILQGIFNLLPVYPLDGGRALQCCLRLIFPKHEKMHKAVNTALLAILCLAAAFAAYRFHAENLMAAIAAVCILRLLLRKKPCKHWRFNVQ